jgi:3-oxoadipate enol-lactonase
VTGPVPTFDEAGSGSPPLLFLHGIGGHRSNFAGQLEHFGARHRCVAWSMPGYDDSPALDEMTFPALAGAVVDLLDRLDIDRAVLVGHSMGGMVALELAATCPQRLCGLVLVATSTTFGGGSPRFVERFRAERLAPLDAGQTPADMAEGIVNRLVARPLLPPVHAAAVAGMSTISARTYRAAVECILTFDRRPALGGLDLPTLLVAGAADPLVPLPVMEAMAGDIPGARLDVVEGAGHLVNLEAPGQFDRALEEWLGGVRG